MEFTRFYFLSLVISLTGKVSGYYPVICVPGIIDNTGKLDRLCQEIAREHPGTEVKFLYPGGFFGSLASLWSQIERYRPEVNDFFAKHPDGVNVVAHSQGGLIMRAVIETTPNHPVRNLILLNSPIMGIYGVPYLQQCENQFCVFLNSIVRFLLKEIIYTSSFQDVASFPNYFHDPTEEDKFLKFTKFLPEINNLIDHPNATDYKNNFLRLNKLVLIATTGDKIVTPYQSAIADYIDEKLNLVPMKNQKVFEDDTFGLRTLNDTDRLTRIIVEDLGHDDLPERLDLVDEYVLPYCD